MLLDQREDSGGNLIVCHGYDLVHILLAKIESMYSRFFYGDTVGYGTDTFEAFDFPMLDRVYMLGAPLACTP